MKKLNILTLSVLLLAGAARAQEATQETEASAPTTSEAIPEETPERGFGHATADLERRVADAVAELEALRARSAEEKLPMSRRLSELETELSGARAEFQTVSRTLQTRSLDLSNLQSEIKTRREEATYLSNLLGEYVRTFESRLLIAELHRYEAPLETAKLALENSNLTEGEVYAAQVALVEASLQRLDDALGGTRFEGTAVGADGLVDQGTFVVVGPASWFLADDGVSVGTAEQVLGSLEPKEVEFADPEDAAAAIALVRDGEGAMPLDPTLGNAHKIAATEETFVEHVKKGGAVMIPIFAMAGLALLIALFKFISFLFLGRASRKRVTELLGAVGRNDEPAAREVVGRIRGPVGRMLAAGVEHMREPRDLVEEIMYETVLKTRLKLNRMLPFIAICAASAPLLGLLGTVTGIINTFRMITVFGSGDVKALSGGISEALITTKFGLIVAIPSLLLHAFLSRKARSVTSQMETTALAFANEVSHAQLDSVVVVPARNGRTASEPDPRLVREQVNAILSDMLEPIVGPGEGRGARGASPEHAETGA